MSTGIDGALDNPIEIGLYPYYDEESKFQGYGRILGDVVWAPVNCGFSSTLTYGKLYQFGRKVGTTYGGTWDSPSSHAAETGAQTHDENGKTSNPDDDKFYKGSGTSSNSDWYSGSTLITWPSIGVTGYLEGKIDDPCPAGWRVPTKDELSILLGGNSAPALENKDDQNGVFLNGTASCSSTTEGAKVFLPAAGRRSFTDGGFYSRGEKGRYYTSTVQKDNTDFVWALYFESGTAYFPTDQPSRACGFSVRCVKDYGSVLLSGDFSVSATKKVNFTKGNLYYSTTDSKYHIEDQQNVTYLTLGQSQYDATHVCNFYWSNSKDWQTSGREPWAQNSNPLTPSTTDKFFCGIDNPMTVDGQSGLYALTGGDSGEWYYLFNSRTNASNLYKTSVTVTTSAGTAENCVVIAPDGYTGTIASSYDAEGWAIAEESGLVCLPAAGNRTGSSLSCIDGFGSYWSSSPYTEWSAYDIQFWSSIFYSSKRNQRDGGYSVRLVRDAN